MKLALAALPLLVACGTQEASSTAEPVLGGDVCQIYSTAGTCGSASGCTWLGTGCACPPDDPNCGCPTGTCAQADGSDAPPTCTCSGSAVCVAINAEPLTCVIPQAGDGDPCARIEGATCNASAVITGLCVCT